MRNGRGWIWAALALIGAIAALFASFNTGERVALNLGFTMIYRVPLVPLIFVAFLLGMTTMFLVGLRHDLRVRRALREAGFGEPIAAPDAAHPWDDDEIDHDPLRGETFAPGPEPDPEPPPRYPP